LVKNHPISIPTNLGFNWRRPKRKRLWTKKWWQYLTWPVVTNRNESYISAIEKKIFCGQKLTTFTSNFFFFFFKVAINVINQEEFFISIITQETKYSQTLVPRTRMGRILWMAQTDLKFPSIFLIFLSKKNNLSLEHRYLEQSNSIIKSRVLPCQTRTSQFMLRLKCISVIFSTKKVCDGIKVWQ
jgi:hypothetical protein